MIRRNLWRAATILIVLSITVPLVGAASFEEQDPTGEAGVESRLPVQTWNAVPTRVVVELGAPPLAAYGRTAAHMGTLSAQERLRQLNEQHATFVQNVTKAVPGATVAEYVSEQGINKSLEYKVAFNGVTIRVPTWDRKTARTLLAMPNVKAFYLEREYAPNLDVSHDYMGSAAMWSEAGGQADAGAGIKIAVLDTGIDPDHPFFDPAGFSYPAGFPKGDTRYTTEKVIVARGYYRPDDPPVNPDPTDYYGHGNGTAGIAAGNLNTTSVISNAFSTITQTVSGVAPAAQLMNYQIFYTAQSGSQSAWTPEILMAIEDMVVDGADVSNNSWGGVDNLNPSVDPTGIAFQNAVMAGVAVVKSAGNDGPSYHSLGDAMPQDLIIVGGNDFGRRVGASASVIAPGSPPPTTTNMLAIEAAFTPPLTGTLAGTYVYVGRMDPANFEGCDPFDAATAAAVNGNIALVSRGTCGFSDKVANAADAGAVAAAIFNNVPGGLPIVMGAAAGVEGSIPAIMVGNEQGLAMTAWDAAHPGEAEVSIDPALAYIPDAALPDTMYQNSSRGPDLAQEMGVDVIAPGSNVWTSFSPDDGWSTPNGTSFSAPFAAGAAAVMAQLYPTWSPTDIRSAMMSTAKNEGIYNDYAHTDHAGVLDMGAGRLRFDHMIDPGLVFDEPSLSFKQMMVGTSETVTVNATDVFQRPADTPFTYTLTISETGTITTTGNFTLSVNPPTLTFSDDGDTASFDVTMEIPADATPGDYEGWVWLRHGPHELHLPAWVRVRPEATENHVLILDDDASAYGFPNYLGFYTNALDELGYTYDIWPVDVQNYSTGRGFPTVAQMQAYDKIIWFTGDSWYTYLELGAELQSRNDLFDLMRSGGANILATGMDLSGYAYAGNVANQYPIEVGMAAGFLQEDAYAPAAWFAPNPAVEGTADIAAFENMLFDLGTVLTPTLGTTAGNQFFVDELAPYSDPALYGGRGFLRSLEPGSDGDGWVGILRSMEPTLENEGMLPGPDYRTAYLSFGLEGVNDATGFTTRAELLGEVFNFFQGDLSATLTVTSTGRPNDMVTLAVDATQTFTSTAHPAQIEQTRWDFGDGSPVYTTDASEVHRLYREPGTYTIRVEVTDNYGHRVLLSDEVVVDNAYLQVAHLAPFAEDASVTVKLDGADPLIDVGYGDSTGYIELSPGEYLVEIVPTGSTGVAISATVDLDPLVHYTAIATGDGVNQDLGLIVLEDDLSAPMEGFAKLRLGHLAPFAPGDATADVRLQDGTPLLTDVTYSTVTPGYLGLPAGEYDLKVTTPGGGRTLIDLKPVTFAEGQILSAFATGDGDNQDLGVFALPAGEEGFFLPLKVYTTYLPAVFRNHTPVLP